MKNAGPCHKSSVALLVASGLTIFAPAFAEEGSHQHGTHAEKMVEMMDADRDGKVTRAEHSAGAKKMFQNMDADQDGKVSRTEMDTHHAQMMGKRDNKDMKEMTSAAKIRTVDANADGVLTAEEHASASTKMFGKMDQDKDGVLTALEMDAGHKKMMSGSDHDH